MFFFLLISCTPTTEKDPNTSSSTTDGTNTTDTDADTDSDTDADSDSDTDSDTDSDSDTDTTNTDPCTTTVDLCAKGDCIYDVVAQPVRLSGAISYGGQQIPDTYGSSYQEWALRLVDTNTLLSYDYQMDGGSDTYKVDVYPGEYDVYFRLNYDSIFPGGITDLTRLGSVSVKKATTYDLAPAPVKLSGSISYDGQQIPDTYGSSYQEWNLRLVDTVSGLSYDYQMDGGSDKYKIDAYPGTYDVYFRLNYDSIFEGGITDLALLGTVKINNNTNYDLAPAPVSLSGKVSYDGQQIPDTYGSSYQEWSLRLVDTKSGLSYDYQMDGGSDRYKVDAYPGTYDVYFRLNYTSIFEGGITDQVKLGTTTITGNGSFDVTPAPVTLSGPISYDGQQIPDTYGSSYQEWQLYLVETGSGLSYSYQLDGGKDRYSVDVYPGTYKVFFRLNYDSIFVGGITDLGDMGTVKVSGDTTYALAPAPVTLSGTITYNGQEIPDTYGSSYQEYSLRLVDLNSDLSFEYALDGQKRYSVDVYPGTYDIYFRLNYDSIFPGGITDWFRIEEAVKLTASDSLALAPEGIPLSGAATYDNQTIPDTYGSSYQEWSLQFQDQYTGLYYSYELDGAPTYDVEIPAGTYNIFFRLNYDSIFDGGITDWGRLESCAEIH